MWRGGKRWDEIYTYFTRANRSKLAMGNGGLGCFLVNDMRRWGIGGSLGKARKKCVGIGASIGSAAMVGARDKALILVAIAGGAHVGLAANGAIGPVVGGGAQHAHVDP
jgi:hypothetical protein